MARRPLRMKRRTIRYALPTLSALTLTWLLLPAPTRALCPLPTVPGIKTVLTINADSTYQLQQDYIDRKDGHDEASGVLQVLDGNVMMLVRPSSGEHSFYKVKDSKSIVMTDSLGNEPEGETAKLYVLTKK